VLVSAPRRNELFSGASLRFQVRNGETPLPAREARAALRFSAARHPLA
jgi:hypothetical protein